MDNILQFRQRLTGNSSEIQNELHELEGEGTGSSLRNIAIIVELRQFQPDLAIRANSALPSRSTRVATKLILNK